MEGLRFKVGPKSFYQTNSEQAYNLYKVAREFAGLTGNELVYDLYTGTGTIANFVSRRARQVIGIEYVPEAIEDAKVNAEINDIKNTLFYAGDMKDILTQEFINEHGRPDVIITDPPRAGMHQDVVDVILFAEPKRIVYAVSYTHLNRAVPFCQHYGVCGGCKWQVLPYPEQIRYKQKQVEDNLRRIGKIELPEISPILGSAKTEFYRNKLEFTFSNKRWLTNEEVRQDVKYDQMNAVGFHIPGAFDKVLAIEKCWLQDDISNRIRNEMCIRDRSATLKRAAPIIGSSR